MQTPQKDKDLVEIMEAVGEIVVDICLNYSYLRSEERNEKRLYIDHLIESYVDKCRYQNKPLPDHVFFRQAIDSYVNDAFWDKSSFVLKTIEGLMGHLIFERLDSYETQLRNEFSERMLDGALA